MDYDSLRLFLHLSRTLHFLRTSRECHVSPSTLSRVDPAARAGGRLAAARARSPHGAPDARGRALRRARARHARALGGAAARSRAARRETRCRGTIAIFASVTACQSFLPELLSGFRQRHPDIHIQLETGYAADALEMLGQGRVDVTRRGAARARAARARLARAAAHAARLRRARARRARSSACARARPLAWAALPVVLPSSAASRARAPTAGSSATASRRPSTARCAGSEAILALVSLGCGVGVVPRLVLDKSPLRAKVRVLTSTTARTPRRVPRRRLHAAPQARLAARARVLGCEARP